MTNIEKNSQAIIDLREKIVVTTKLFLQTNDSWEKRIYKKQLSTFEAQIKRFQTMSGNTINSMQPTLF